MNDEKRKYLRLQAIVPIDYMVDDENVFLFYATSDISRNGAYISAVEPLPVGSSIDLIFSPTPEFLQYFSEKVVLKGKVRRTERTQDSLPGKGSGMGVEFLNMSDAAWELLHRALIEERQDLTFDMKRTVADTPGVVQYQLDQVRRHSRELRKEAALYLKNVI